MSKKLMLCLALIVPMIIGMMSVGIGQAAIEVDNTAQIVYYSNVQMAFSYTATDTARLIVLYGPQMSLAKNLQNDVTGESSPESIAVNKGDTVTVVLYSANNEPQADTSSWHVTVMDTFAVLVGVGANSATVGPTASDSFVYVAGSETATTGESHTLPDSVAYYANGAWGTWYAYGSKDEADPLNDDSDLGKNYITGIKWYWRRIDCVRKYTPGTGLEDWVDANYKVRVQFKLKKNDN